MEVMLDTNVLFSAIFFPSKRMDELFSLLTKKHRIVLSSYSLEELYRVTKRKVPQKLLTMEIFLQKLPYRFVYTPRRDLIENDFNLRDAADYPILLSALIADADILITGDHDFDDVNLERPEIMTPSDLSITIAYKKSKPHSRKGWGLGVPYSLSAGRLSRK